MVTLYCEETPELKLGPGTTQAWPGSPGRMTQDGFIPATEGREAGDVIVFGRGFATFDEKKFPDWKAWVDAPGTPNIRIIDESTGEGLSGEPGNTCPICARPFKNSGALTFHLRTHAKG